MLNAFSAPEAAETSSIHLVVGSSTPCVFLAVAAALWASFLCMIYRFDVFEAYTPHK